MQSLDFSLFTPSVPDIPTIPKQKPDKDMVKQADIRLFRTMKSTFVGLRVAGIHAMRIQFKTKSKKQQILASLVMLWHFFTLSSASLFLVMTLVNCFRSVRKRGPYVVDAVRLFAAVYRSLVLRSQKAKIESLLAKIESVLELFPESLVKEHKYKQICVLVGIYSSVQGKHRDSFTEIGSNYFLNCLI